MKLTANRYAFFSSIIIEELKADNEIFYPQFSFVPSLLGAFCQPHFLLTFTESIFQKVKCLHTLDVNHVVSRVASVPRLTWVVTYSVSYGGCKSEFRVSHALITRCVISARDSGFTGY